MKKKMSVLGALLLAVVVTGYSVSGTYAKYTEDFTGATQTATIAKWAVTVNDKPSTENFTFDLFETHTNTSLKDSTAKLMAPGSTGQFKIKVKNDSDVKAGYTVSFTVGGETIPLQWSTDGGTTWSNTLTGNTTPIAIGASGEEEIVVDWKWDFGDAVNDTAHASTATADKTVTVDATVTVSQMAA